VKKIIRISGILFLTALYCFALGIGAEPLTYSDIQTNNQEKYDSTISSFLAVHTSQTESSVNNLNDFPAPGVKNLFDDLWAINKVTEQLNNTIFSNYTGISINILVNSRKADTLFPSHYFW